MAKLITGLKRGEVARRAGVNIETLRFYERQGVLSPPPRLDSGYRAYPPETVDIVIFVKRAQELGFTLKEVRSLLALVDARGSQCEAVQVFARQKVATIQKKIDDLVSMESALNRLLKECAEPGRERSCPILESLVGRRRGDSR